MRLLTFHCLLLGGLHVRELPDSYFLGINRFSIIGFYVSIFGRSATASLTWRSKEETHVFSLTSGKTPER
jgi:hypothetical protein